MPHTASCFRSLSFSVTILVPLRDNGKELKGEAPKPLAKIDLTAQQINLGVHK